jgi:hypothetical protein
MENIGVVESPHDFLNGGLTTPRFALGGWTSHLHYLSRRFSHSLIFILGGWTIPWPFFIFYFFLKKSLFFFLKKNLFLRKMSILWRKTKK